MERVNNRQFPGIAAVSWALLSVHGLLLLVLLITGVALYVGRVWWRLRHIPGPFWAKITNIQRVLWVRTGRSHEIHQAVHDRYGEMVRFGPNMVSLGNPAWIPQLYPIRPGFPKVREHSQASRRISLMLFFLLNQSAGRLLSNFDALHT